MSVYVKNDDGAKLMPCTEAKARKLLEAGKAKIVDYRPFTIQLSFQCEGYTQDITCGIDKGSSITGITCVGNGTVLLAAEIQHRRDVKEKMEDRRDRSEEHTSELQSPAMISYAVFCLKKERANGGSTGSAQKPPGASLVSGCTLSQPWLKQAERTVAPFD